VDKDYGESHQDSDERISREDAARFMAAVREAIARDAPAGSMTSSNQGYHGLRRRQECRWKPPEWKLYEVLGGVGMIVDVEDYSPAWRAGVRSGFFLIEIGGVEFDAFEGRRAPIGTTVRIKGIHPTRGALDTQLTLTASPKPKRPLANHPVECGRTVAGKEERPAWRRAIETHPEITDAEVRFAAFLADKCVYLDNQTREKSGWSIARLAKALGMSHSKFVRVRARFLRRGFLDSVSGKRSRKVTIYRLCWPKGQEPDLSKKVIPFPSASVQRG
jgi:hypothetical protein